MALVLGILGLVVCQIIAPIAWYLGHKEVSAIDAGRRSPENRGMGLAGKILGIVGTVLIALFVGFIFLFVLVGVSSA